MKSEGAPSLEVGDFEVDVVEASRRRPVLVDFWAPWCGPCRALGPVLEKLAAENDGRWVLVKVNTDQHPEISSQYQVRGIPAVKLFVDGKVVDEFTGALPEYAVKQWLEKAIPTRSKKLVEEAERALDGGDVDRGRELLEQVLGDEPDNPKGQILMARSVVFDNPDRALSLVEDAAFAGPAYVQMGEAIKALVAFEAAADNPELLPDEQGKQEYLAAARAMKSSDYERAIGHLIDVLKVNRYYNDDGARKAGIALFALLGEQHPVTRRQRRTFDMWLF